MDRPLSTTQTRCEFAWTRGRCSWMQRVGLVTLFNGNGPSGLNIYAGWGTKMDKNGGQR